MRTIAATLMTVALAGQAAQAQVPASTPSDHQIAACRSWGDQLGLTVRRLKDHGLLSSDDASAVNGLIGVMSQRCSGSDAGRISGLYTILLDTLVDQSHQP